MATFRKRNGKWQARIQVSGGPSQARTFYKLSDARKWAQQIEEAYQQGLMETRPDPITLYEAFQRYLNDLKKSYLFYDYHAQKYNTIQNEDIKSSINKLIPSAKEHRTATSRGYNLPHIDLARQDFESIVGTQLDWEIT